MSISGDSTLMYNLNPIQMKHSQPSPPYPRLERRHPNDNLKHRLDPHGLTCMMIH